MGGGQGAKRSGSSGNAAASGFGSAIRLAVGRYPVTFEEYDHFV